MATRARFGLDHLFGNANILRNINPRLVGKLRRRDPDGFSSLPYFPSLTSTTLFVEYTKEVLGVVTPATANLTFAADGLQAAIDQFNALDSGNIEALDVDGFFAIRNRNGGKTHYIGVVSGTAVPLFGFEISPYPGSRSVAGEFASAPTNRDQKNPTGTMSLAKDETLDSSAINRLAAGFADVLARFSREIDREVVGFGQAPLDSSNLFVIGSIVCIKFPTPVSGMRVPLLAFPDTAIPSAPTIGELSSLFRIQTVAGDELVLSNKTVPRVFRVLWGNPSTVGAINGSQAFSTYSPLPSGTAFSVFGSNPGGPVTKVVKRAAVTISEITGDVVKCSGTPLFVTNGVMPGDTAHITSSTVTSPFLHNGEFIVDEVIDENTLVLRPKGKFDPIADSANEIPGGLNQGTSGMGQIEILVGAFLNGPGLIFATNVSPSVITELQGAVLHFATGARLKDTPAERFGRSPKGGIAALLSSLASSANTATDGASFIGAATTADLLTATVRAQLIELATNWAKLDRENTWTKTQTVRGGLADSSAALKTDTVPTVRKLLWELNNGNEPPMRVYWQCSSGFGIAGIEITNNAVWDPIGTQWTWDIDSQNSTRFSFTADGFVSEYHDGFTTSPWTDSDWVLLAKTGPGVPGLDVGNFGIQSGDDNMNVGYPRFSASSAVSADDGTATDPIRTLLFQDNAGVPSYYPGGVFRRQSRIYISGSGMGSGLGRGGGPGTTISDSLEFAFNCFWGGDQWVMDDLAENAMVVRFDPEDGIIMLTRQPFGAGGWGGFNSYSFDDILLNDNVDQSISGPTGWNSMCGFHPSTASDYYGGNYGARHQISPRQVPRAWGYIQVTGATVLEGENIAFVEDLTTFLRVHWANSFKHAAIGSLGRYAVFVGFQNDNAFTPIAITADADVSSVDYADLYFRSVPGGGSLINIDTFIDSIFISVLAFGLLDPV